LGIDSSYWTNFTERPDNVSFGLYSNPVNQKDSIFIRFEHAGTSWN